MYKWKAINETTLMNINHTTFRFLINCFKCFHSIVGKVHLKAIIQAHFFSVWCFWSIWRINCILMFFLLSYCGNSWKVIRSKELLMKNVIKFLFTFFMKYWQRCRVGNSNEPDLLLFLEFSCFKRIWRKRKKVTIIIVRYFISVPKNSDTFSINETKLG